MSERACADFGHLRRGAAVGRRLADVVSLPMWPAGQEATPRPVIVKSPTVPGFGERGWSVPGRARLVAATGYGGSKVGGHLTGCRMSSPPPATARRIHTSARGLAWTTKRRGRHCGPTGRRRGAGGYSAGWRTAWRATGTGAASRYMTPGRTSTASTHRGCRARPSGGGAGEPGRLAGEGARPRQLAGAVGLRTPTAEATPSPCRIRSGRAAARHARR